MATIAFHNGSAVRRAHNVRSETVVRKQEHIDPNGVYEIWRDETERQAYDRLFGEAVDRYNEKQTREDRKIKDYYSRVKGDKQKHTCYEAIVGIYGEECSVETGKKILSDFYRGWAERNTSLEVIGCYYHADEQGGPHLHIDYIPVATGYKNGMEKQASMVKALENIGYRKEGKQTAQIKWEASERNVLERLCREHGLSVEHPGTKQHLDTEAYKVKKESERIKKAKAEEPELHEKDVPLMHNRVTVDRSALEEIRSQAEKQRLHQNDPTVRAQSKVLRAREKQAKALEKKAQDQLRTVESFRYEAAESRKKEEAAQARIRAVQEHNEDLKWVIDFLTEIIAGFFTFLRDLIDDGFVPHPAADELERKMEEAEDRIYESTGIDIREKEEDGHEI